MQLTKTILTTLTLSTLVWSNVLAKESKIIVSTGRIISELKPFDELMEEFNKAKGKIPFYQRPEGEGLSRFLTS